MRILRFINSRYAVSFSRRTSGRCERSEESRFSWVETLRYAQGITANCVTSVIKEKVSER